MSEYDIKKSGIIVLCRVCDKYIGLLEDMQGKHDYLVQHVPDTGQYENVIYISVVGNKLSKWSY